MFNLAYSTYLRGWPLKILCVSVETPWQTIVYVATLHA